MIIYQPLVFASKEHKSCFDSLADIYKDDSHNTIKTLFFILTASPTIRSHLTDCYHIKDGEVIINEDVLNQAWVTKKDATLIRFGFNLYDLGLPVAQPLEAEIHCPKRYSFRTSNIFMGLAIEYELIVLDALYLWGSRDHGIVVP